MDLKSVDHLTRNAKGSAIMLKTLFNDMVRARLWLCLVCNSCIEVYSYKISRDFYIWTLPLFVLKTLFC